MASDLLLGRGRPRPRLFLLLLLLFLIAGTCLASAVTGADYVRGNGGADFPDDRAGSAQAAFSAQDDRCVLVVPVSDAAPQAFLLWKLRPALSAMTVTAFAADMRLPDGAGEIVTLAELFGEGGRGGCERVCAALTRARQGAPAHYIVVTDETLRALMARLGDTLTITLPEAWEVADRPGAPLTGGRQAVTAEQLISVLAAPASDDPDDRAAYLRLHADVWTALCDRFFTAARQDALADDFAVLADAAVTDLTVSHFVRYRDALAALAAHGDGRF